MSRRAARGSQMSTPEIVDILQHRSLFEIGYETAAGYLKQLRISIGDSLETALQTAECELRLQRGKEEKSIRRVRAVLVRFGHNADSVHWQGEKRDRGVTKQRVQALILYDVAHQLYEERHHEPDEAAKWVKSLVQDIHIAAYDLVVEEGLSSTHVAVNYGAKLAEDLFQYLQTLNITPELETLVSASCIYRIADIYFRAEAYETSVPLLQKATEKFSKVVFEDACDHELYCALLWTLGNCYFRLQNFERADECYATAIAEIKRLPITAEKWLKIVKEDMDKARYKLGRRPLLGIASDIGELRDEELKKSVRICQGLNTLDAHLTVAECELRLETEEEENSLRRVRDFILSNPTYTWKKMKKAGETYDAGYARQRVKALILYRISHELFSKEYHRPDRVVEWLNYLVQDIRLAAYDLAAQKGVSRKIAVRHGAEYAEFLLRCLHRVKNATPTLLLLANAKCLYYIANIYFRAEEYENSIAFFRKAMQYYDAIFPGTARNIEHYCLSLWNLGNCYYRLKRFDDAERFYIIAKSEIERSEVSQCWLKIVKRDLGKARRNLSQIV